jgi:hypothetical protein
MIQPYRIALAAIVCCTLFTVFTWTSCKKDPCKDTSCINGGVCNDGKCKCPEGFEGAGCEIDVRPGFNGAWEGRLCNSSSAIYWDQRVEIKTNDSAGLAKIMIDKHRPVYGKISGNVLSIDKQIYEAHDIYTGYIKGTMTQIRDTITYHYYYETDMPGMDTIIYEECSGRYMRD